MHFNDYDNLVADEYGCVTADFTDETLTLEGPQSIINRSVIIEATLSGSSTGSSEEPCHNLACGIIKRY
jgi:Cu/Zn superoxide dismutase